MFDSEYLRLMLPERATVAVKIHPAECVCTIALRDSLLQGYGTSMVLLWYFYGTSMVLLSHDPKWTESFSPVAFGYTSVNELLGPRAKNRLWTAAFGSCTRIMHSDHALVEGRRSNADTCTLQFFSSLQNTYLQFPSTPIFVRELNNSED